MRTVCFGCFRTARRTCGRVGVQLVRRLELGARGRAAYAAQAAVSTAAHRRVCVIAGLGGARRASDSGEWCPDPSKLHLDLSLRRAGGVSSSVTKRQTDKRTCVIQLSSGREVCKHVEGCGRLRRSGSSQRAAARALLTQGSGFLPVGYGFVRFSAAVPYPPTACAKNPGLSRDAIPSLPLGPAMPNWGPRGHRRA